MKLGIAAAAVAVIYALPAVGQEQCGTTIEVYDVLAQRYGESRQASGFSSNGVLIEMFANRESGTWTALITRPDGLSCIVADGQYFSLDASPPPAQGEEM